MFVIFPRWFYKKYPHIYKTLEINQHRLTSNFDIWATMKDIITFSGLTGKGDTSHRGISLFKEIPLERNCKHAGIPDEFCVCVEIVNTNVSSKIVDRLSKSLLDHVIEKAKNHSSLCHKLDLDEVVNTIQLKETFYKMTIKTKPGGALFEGNLEMSKENKVNVVGNVNRVNLYRGTAECIDDMKTFPFCYCKEKPNEERMNKFHKH